MEKVHMIVDLGKCVGCFNCLMACKDEHVDNQWLPYTDRQQKKGENWINPTRHERGRAPYTDLCFVPRLCQHCDNAPCQSACPEAVTTREDGVVLLDAEKAAGNRALVDACPYGMISWNEEIQAAQKCTLCAHLLDQGWREPRCVQACPLRALSIIKCEDAEFEEIVKNQGLKPLTEGENRPRVLYKNLERYSCHFISGGLALMDGDIERVAAGASVTLSLGGTALKQVSTDFFGEFKFDCLPANSGVFRISCALEGYEPLEAEVFLGEESVLMETLQFKRAV